MAIVHELSWSTSRARTFDSCRRKYYYDYYLSWLGWGRNADPERRNAYLLKKMTRMPMFAGDIVHRAIERYYARRDQGQSWTADEAIQWAVTELRRGYKESRDGGWKARPAKSIRLSEHHYGEARIDEASGEAGKYGKRYVDRIKECLNTFFEAPELKAVREVEPGDWLACEEMSTFELFDTKIFAIPDFAYLDRAHVDRAYVDRADVDRNAAAAATDAAPGATAVRIVDWKTGAPREADRFQLEVYAFYARDRWKVDPLQTTAVDAYLGDGSLAEVQITDEVLENALARIESSLTEMKAVHFNADDSKGDAEAFPKVPEEDAARHCSMCGYRELCDRVSE